MNFGTMPFGAYSKAFYEFININELAKSENYDDIHRAKPKKMSLTIELKSLTKEKMFKEVNYA